MGDGEDDGDNKWHDLQLFLKDSTVWVKQRSMTAGFHRNSPTLPTSPPDPLPQTGGPPGVLGPKREAKAFMQKNNSPFFFFFVVPR